VWEATKCCVTVCSFVAEDLRQNRKPSSSAGIVTSQKTRTIGVKFIAEMENVLYVAVSKPALEPILLRIQWVSRAFSMWVKHLA
jgi:hypothetical protein